MAYVSHVAGPTRCFDHVYDPIYEASSQRDVWRASIQAIQKSAPIQITSIYQTMFSDMPNRPGYYCWKRQNPLPHFAHPGDIKLKSNYIQRIEHGKPICIEGACRCNFFHYPPDCVKTLNLRLSIPRECECVEPPKNKYESVGCQTIYRESSAQTKPYLPDYCVPEGEPETPEVARIANLITGNEPPGEFETQIIERARRRRQWEKELPPTGSLKEWDQRRTIIEAFEWEEFVAREEDIQEMQELRMELVKNLVADRETSMRASSATKLQHAAARIEDERKQKLKKLNHKFAREMRKLELARKNIPRKYKVENIVKEHIDQASDLYAPQMRFGIHPKRLHFVPFKSSFQARLENLELDRVDPKKVKCTIKKYNRLAEPKGTITEIEKGFNNDEQLTKLYETLKTLRNSSNIDKSLPSCLERVHKEAIVAAETPIGPSEDLYEMSETHCCIYLQKIIKGRAVQKILYNGRDRSRGLIEEIQTTHMLSAVSAMYPGLSNDTIRARLRVQSQQKRFAQMVQHDKQSQEIYKESEASTIGVLLEFLEKELRRMYEQRRIQALCLLAERERMKREAEEAGRRQTENQRRQETEEIYRNLMKASQDTVSMFLENVLMEETDKVADEDARKRIQQMARKIDREVHKSVNNKCQTIVSGTNEDIINDLVKNFVFPEVQKRIARHNMELRRQRHLLAAHETLYGHVENIFYTPTPRPSESIIASHILNNLIDKVLSCDSFLSKIGRHENVARHEAMAAIRKILKRMFPERKWKTSAERIVSATISGLINDASAENRKELKATPKISEHKWLKEIIEDISNRLWQHAYAEFNELGEHAGEQEKTTDELINYLEDKLKPIYIKYKLGEMDENFEEESSNDELMIPFETLEPHFFNMPSDTEDDIGFLSKSGVGEDEVAILNEGHEESVHIKSSAVLRKREDNQRKVNDSVARPSSEDNYSPRNKDAAKSNEEFNEKINSELVSNSQLRSHVEADQSSDHTTLDFPGSVQPKTPLMLDSIGSTTEEGPDPEKGDGTWIKPKEEEKE